MEDTERTLIYKQNVKMKWMLGMTYQERLHWELTWFEGYNHYLTSTFSLHCMLFLISLYAKEMVNIAKYRNMTYQCVQLLMIKVISNGYFLKIDIINSSKSVIAFKLKGHCLEKTFVNLSKECSINRIRDW